MKIKFPVKRVVLCIEEEELMGNLSVEEKLWIELPLFILFLSLINNIDIDKLEDCFTQGKLSVVGNITQFELDCEQFTEILNSNKLNDLKFICNKMKELPLDLKTIQLEQLVNHPGRLKYKNESLEEIHLNRLNLTAI